MASTSPLRFAAALGCAACGVSFSAAPAQPPPPDAGVDWRRVATPADRDRLRRWRSAWMEATARVRASGEASVLDDRALFDPDHALADPVPPPGHYLCRVVKLGANGTAMHEVTSYPGEACRVRRDAAGVSIYKIAGTQRPVVTLYPDGSSRAVMLGTLVLGDETRPLAYGRDARRDLAGYVERIGDQRWRLVLPYPTFESLIDIVELTPDPPPR